MPPIKYKTEEERKEAKRASNRATRKDKVVKKKYAKRELTKKQEIFCKVYPVLKNATAAAKEAGYSEKSAGTVGSANMQKVGIAKGIAREEKNLKQAFNDLGLGEDYLAKNFKNIIDYNQEIIIDVVGVGNNARTIERMRDAKVAASALVNVAKLSGSSLENNRDSISDNISADTSLLAIKSLIKKLNIEGLRLVMDSCEALIMDSAVIVD